MSGYPTGRTGDRGDQKKFYVQKFYVPFCSLKIVTILQVSLSDILLSSCRHLESLQNEMHACIGQLGNYEHFPFLLGFKNSKERSVSIQNKIGTCIFRGHQGTRDQGPLNGGVSRSGLVLPFLSFLGLSRFFRDFPDLFPDSSLFSSRPLKSSYEEQSRKGPRHNLDLSRKKWETPRFGTPPA